MVNVVLREAVEWNGLERMPCVIHLLPIPKASLGFFDFEEYESLVTAAEELVSAAARS